MVTTKEAINVLNYSENHVVRKVQLLSAGFVPGYLMNDIDWRRLHRVIVDPSASGEKQSNSISIRVWMTSFVKTQKSAIRKALERAKAWLNYGCYPLMAGCEGAAASPSPHFLLCLLQKNRSNYACDRA